MNAHLCAHPGVCSAPPPKLGEHGRKVGREQKKNCPAFRARICALHFQLLLLPLIPGFSKLPFCERLERLGLWSSEES